MFNPFKAIGSYFRKSAGERKLLAMLNGDSSSITPYIWSSKRSEFPLHFSGWNYAAIDAIASEIAGMTPLYAFKREGAQAEMKKCLSPRERKKALTGLADTVALEPVPADHPLVRLDARPNPIDIGWTFRYKLAMFLRISGEAYRWNVPSDAGYPTEAWIIPPHWVWPIPGKDKLVGEYEIRPMSTWLPDEPGNWHWFGGGAGKFRIPAEQIVPYFLPSPHTLVGGYSPIGACSAWTDGTDNIDKSRIFRFQNDAFPSVAIEFDKDVDPESITQPEIDRLKMMIKEKYAGVKRTGEPVVLGPGMRMVFFATTPKDMAYVEGFAQMRDSLMACHKTGPIVVGLGNETTHAAGRAVRAGWHTSTITPMTRMLGQFDTEHMCRPMDESLVCYYPNSIPEDIEFEQKQRVEFLDRDVITLDEARAQSGLPPHPNTEIGGMTVSEVAAHFVVPKGMGDEPGLLTPEGNPDRVGQIFQPQNGNGSLLNGDRKMKALVDLRNELLLK